jgi:hypothetical protein
MAPSLITHKDRALVQELGTVVPDVRRLKSSLHSHRYPSASSSVGACIEAVEQLM